MSTAVIYKLAPTIILKDTSDTILLSDMMKDDAPVYELNGSAIEMCSYLKEGVTIEALFENLEEELEDFGKPEQQEVLRFLDILVDLNLVIKETID